MADTTFIFHADWLDNIQGLPQDLQEKVIAEIVRYGTNRQLLYETDPTVAAFVNFVKKNIDFSKEKYEEKRMNGVTNGRIKKVNDYEVWQLASKGLTAQKVADELGVSKATVDHCRGWKERKNPNFIG